MCPSVRKHRVLENEFHGWHGMLPVGSTYGYLLTRTYIERTFNGQYLFVDTRILTPNSREHHPFPRWHFHASTHINHGLRHHIIPYRRTQPWRFSGSSNTNYCLRSRSFRCHAVEAVACLLHSVGKSEGDDATRHGDNHRTSNIVSIIHPPLVPRPYPNAYKLSRGTNTKLIRLIWFAWWQ